MTTKGYAFCEVLRLVKIFERKSVEMFHSSMNPRCGCKYTIEDINWLVENGYLFHYVRHCTSGSKQSWGGWNATDHHYYGITKKGWGVADKYLAQCDK